MGSIFNEKLPVIAERTRDRRIVTTVLLLVLTVVILRNAWITEDAYIMFRTIDNWSNGFGLTWNINERVQAYTDPLWMFILAAAHWITGEMYFTPILLGLFCTIAAVWILGSSLARSTWLMVAAIVPLILSKAFVDYSTSGLENPITFLTLALFFRLFLKPASSDPRKHLLHLSLVMALAMLDRMDTALFFAPAFAYEFFRLSGWRYVGSILIGFLPFILWEIFAIIYYGFPFPNTAYAKLNTGIEPYESIVQGVLYLFNSLASDPITLFTIAISLVLLLAVRSGRSLMLATGIIFYLIYIIRVGGDFMSGRFLSGPLFAAAIGIAFFAEFRVRSAAIAVFLASALLIGLANSGSPIFSRADFNLDYSAAVDRNGIADERGYYFQGTGLLNFNKNKFPDHGMRTTGEEFARNVLKQPVVVAANIGMTGYFSTPELHIVDQYGLSDGLLARLPSVKHARIGHFNRDIPHGYLRSIRTGENHIFHPDLARYYEALSTIITGPIFSFDRAKEIFRMNKGSYDHLIRSYLETRHDAIYPLNDLLTYEAYSQYTAGGWFEWNNGNIWALGPENSMRIQLKEPRSGILHIAMTTPLAHQRLEVLHGSQEIGRLEWQGTDTMRMEIPIELNEGENRITFRSSNWNRLDSRIAETNELLAVKFIELGIADH